MGKKKSQQQHVSQSMGQMVSRAALAQLGPDIQQMAEQLVNNLGQRLALKQAETTQLMFTRIVSIEESLIDKGVVTKEDLQNKVADIEDRRDNAVKADDGLTVGDTARIEVRTKDVSAKEFESGVTKLKVTNTGSGDTLGEDVENGMVGMKTGDVKVVTFAEGKLNAEIKLSRLSRPVPKSLDAPLNLPNENSTLEGQDASPDQV